MCLKECYNKVYMICNFVLWYAIRKVQKNEEMEVNRIYQLLMMLILGKNINTIENREALLEASKEVSPMQRKRSICLWLVTRMQEKIMT